MLVSDWCLTLTTTVRVVDRVHNTTTNRWAPALPAVPTRLSDSDILVFDIADLSNGGAARYRNTPQLP